MVVGGVNARSTEAVVCSTPGCGLKLTAYEQEMAAEPGLALCSLCVRDSTRRSQLTERERRRREVAGEPDPLLGPVPEQGDGYLLPFKTLARALVDVPDEPDWQFESYAAKGVITAVGGKFKAGKSTLVFGLMKAFQNGTQFIGRNVKRSRVLFLTEEQALSLNEKFLLFGLDQGDENGIHVLQSWQVSRDIDWETVIEESARYCVDHEIDVLIIDTWDKFSRAKENDADEVNLSLRPLREIAGLYDLAVIIVAHQRKSGGKHGDAIRGSSAFAGYVDIIVELERAPGELGETAARILYGTSRFASTPDRIMLTWNADAAEFVADDYDAAREAQERASIVKAATTTWKTRDELGESVSIRRQELSAHLTALVEDGSLDRCGAGKRGDPFLFALPGTPAPEGVQTAQEALLGDQIPFPEIYESTPSEETAGNGNADSPDSVPNPVFEARERNTWLEQAKSEDSVPKPRERNTVSVPESTTLGGNGGNGNKGLEQAKTDSFRSGAPGTETGPSEDSVPAVPSRSGTAGTESQAEIVVDEDDVEEWAERARNTLNEVELDLDFGPDEPEEETC